MPLHRMDRQGRRALSATCAGLLPFLACGPARAIDLSQGAWQINLDTTLSSSVDIRTSDVDPRFVGFVNGGNFYLPNGDNGTLNYKSGTPVAAQQRITTELSIKRDDYGIFLRATGFYDPIIDSERTDFQPLTRAAVRDIGADLRLLDAYGFASPVVFGHRFDLRVGAQALNWGESTFIPFGINVITPFDQTALRTPGAELRTAFLPIPAVDVKTQLTDNTSLEAFWQFYWTRDRLEPKGSFFSTNDTLTDGGMYGLLFDNFPDSYSSVNALNFGKNDALGAALPRSLDRHPTTLDEFGVALRTSVPSLSDAEFGLYFENFHSRLPFGSYRTGTESSVLPSTFASLGLGPPAPSYTSTASYFADYPKDIHLIGVSWNFNAPGGIAVQGEFSHRINQPLQLAASDTALLVNSPAACFLGAALGPALGASAISVCNQARIDPTITLAGGVPGFQETVDGWRRYGVSQLQTTFTKLFGAQGYGINSIALVGEIGFDYAYDFPTQAGVFNTPYNTDVNSAFVKAATVNGGAVNAPLAYKGFATPFSGAYTLLAIVDMPNVLPFGIDMKPTFSFQHDFSGTSPYGANVFLAHTAAASAGVTFNYLQAWSLGVQYTNHFPIGDSGRFDGLLDRDFVSATLSYEF